MFIDASALCSMLTNEDDARELLARLQRSPRRITSPLAVWETVINVARIAARAQFTTKRDADLHKGRFTTLAFQLVLKREANGLRLADILEGCKPLGESVHLFVLHIERHGNILRLIFGYHSTDILL